jgi:predicted ATPase
VDSLTVAEALRYSAIELFVDRAASSCDSFRFTDEEIRYVAEICQRLDGNALAIELAAGRVDAFGVRGVAARLGNRFDLLKGGRRTALPRHQALSATLDWSYDLLSEAERAVLRRLSIFAGNFSLEAASEVAADELCGREKVVDCISALVAKSLISAEVRSVEPRYRLLDTTIAYSRQKLAECGELSRFARRHAGYYLTLFKGLADEALVLDPSAWVLRYGDQLDNVRTALDWAFAEEGDGSLGTSLTIAVVPLWLNLSLMDECLQRVRKAIARLDPAAPDSSTREMHLYNALGVALYSIGPGGETQGAWEQVLSLAERLDNSDFRLRALWGLWTVCVTGGGQRMGLSLAKEFARVASEVSDAGAQLVGERLQGISHHFLGELAPARLHLERMLEKARGESDRSDIDRFQFNQPLASQAYLANVLWVQGFPDKALEAAELSIAGAQAIGHSLSLCYALGSAGCPVALWLGDLTKAGEYIDMLMYYATKHRLALWTRLAKGFKGALMLRSANRDQGLRLLLETTSELRDAGYRLYHTAFLAEVAQGLASAGQSGLALKTIAEALAQAVEVDESWCMPELLRIKGELLSDTGDDRGARGEACLVQALALARRQKALSWELRVTMSLGRLRRGGPLWPRARADLKLAHDHFREGFNSHDYRAARDLLQED